VLAQHRLPIGREHEHREACRFRARTAHQRQSVIGADRESGRNRDDLECRYAYGISGTQALLEAWEESRVVHCICADNGEPLGVAGLNGSVIWLLGTDGLAATPQRRVALALGGRRWTDMLLKCQRARGESPLLENWVFAANVESVHWLRSMGFQIATPEPMGPSCQLFRHAWRNS
jgi:hypothetical protein